MTDSLELPKVDMYTHSNILCLPFGSVMRCNEMNSYLSGNEWKKNNKVAMWKRN